MKKRKDDGQPRWQCVGTIGDVNPIEHDGGWVLVDTTGQYAPELEYLDRENPFEDDPKKVVHLIHRIVLEPCTWINGILSDNKFHPECVAFFADDGLVGLANTFGLTPDEMAAMFCSTDVCERAQAWFEAASIHGWVNFGDEPISWFKPWQLRKRYKRAVFQVRPVTPAK